MFDVHGALSWGRALNACPGEKKGIFARGLLVSEYAGVTAFHSAKERFEVARQGFRLVVVKHVASRRQQLFFDIPDHAEAFVKLRF